MPDCYACGRPSENPFIVQGAKVCPGCKVTAAKSDEYRNMRRSIALRAVQEHARREPGETSISSQVIRLLADLLHFADAERLDLGDLLIAANGLHSRETWPNTWDSKGTAMTEQARRRAVCDTWRDANEGALSSLRGSDE